MKIYPSLHTVKETQRIDAADIPLACIDTDYTEFNYYIAREPFIADKKDPVLIQPYEEFSSEDVYLFDGNSNRVSIPLQRIEDKFVYIPQNAKEFTPAQFSFSALVKKAMHYKSEALYDIKVAAGGTEDFLLKLMPLFGDAPRRGLCPANISVNNQSPTPDSLYDTSLAGNDIMFIETEDGVNFMVDGKPQPLDIEAMLNSNVNVWLSVETFGSLLKEKVDGIYRFSSPMLYTSGDYELSYKKYFDMDAAHPNYPITTYAYTNLFSSYCGVLLLEKKNGGFVIISHSSLLIPNNSRLIYEILMYAVYNSYYRTPEKTLWITDEPVDYITVQPFDQRHPNVNLNNLLANDRYVIGQDYVLLSIDTSTPEVKLSQISYDKNLFFRKGSLQPDPAKSEGMISVYTTKHSVILYSQEVIRKLETGLTVDVVINDAGQYIVGGPCRSTSCKIDQPEKTELEIPNPNREYYLCHNTTFLLVDVAQYNIALHGSKMVYIKPIHKPVITNYDMRIPGGGLPEDMTDNYNLLDIGHRKGRPVRLGYSTVIKLPARLKKYEARIMEEAKRHASSGDFVALVFEE